MAAALFREDRSFPNNSPGGGIGRRAGLKIQWAVMPVRVRFPSRVLFTDRLGGNFSIKPLFFKPLHIQPPFHFPRFYPFIYHPIYHLKDFYTSARGYFPARQGARKKHSGATWLRSNAACLPVRPRPSRYGGERARDIPPLFSARGTRNCPFLKLLR